MSTVERLARRQIKGAMQSESMIESMLKKLGIIVDIKYRCVDCGVSFEKYEDCIIHRKAEHGNRQ